MKAGLYPRLALVGMRGSRQLLLPYLLSGAGLVALYDLLASLSVSPRIAAMRGGASTQTVLAFGAWVVFFFSVIFLFYSGTFLLRRRKRELGLYNVLGLTRGQIGRVLCWESFFTALFALAAGLLFGTLFEKLCELIFAALSGSEPDPSFSLAPGPIFMTLVLYSALYLGITLVRLLQMRRLSAVSLLSGERTGEKAPRGGIFMGLLGLVLLACAYGIALSVKSAVESITFFFFAVLLVIAATYLLMIFGSVQLCRLLQKNKRFYYNPRHFVSVSSLVYRMKRNGAGMASICILATMVLVMLSTTSSLYFGADDTITRLYPGEQKLTLTLTEPDQLDREKLDPMRQALEQTVRQQGGTPRVLYDLRLCALVGAQENGAIVAAKNDPSRSDFFALFLIDAADYLAGGGKGSPEPGQALFVTDSNRALPDRLELGSLSFSAQTLRDDSFSTGFDTTLIGDEVVAVIPDLKTAAKEVMEDFPSLQWYCAFDTGLPEQSGMLEDALAPYMWADGQFLSVQSREQTRGDFIGSFAGLLFLGVVLTLAFSAAAVMILYYKQICEGYEDQARFAILQKVGMSHREIRRNVDSQLWLVFFLPLCAAALHLCFAFPMIRQILLLFQLRNTGLFAAVCAITFLFFSLFYGLAYRFTTRAYTRIVSA